MVEPMVFHHVLLRKRQRFLLRQAVHRVDGTESANAAGYLRVDSSWSRQNGDLIRDAVADLRFAVNQAPAGWQE